MSGLQASTLPLSSSSSSSTPSTCSFQNQGRILSTLNLPKKPVAAQLTLPKPTTKNLVEKFSNMKGIYTNPITIKRDEDSPISSPAIAKLYALAEVVSDRIEMHKNIEEQRNNWNGLLLNSINAITLTATTMTGLAAVGHMGGDLLALNLTSSLLFSAATGMSLIMNKLQPSQLAEEQRNATRLFKQLHGEIQMKLAIRNFSSSYVNGVVDKILALDKAFPLPLVGGVMLEKFPKIVEPSTWWPQRKDVRSNRPSQKIERNGWNDNLEKEMRTVLRMLKRKDSKEYMRLGKLVLKVNKTLAISGPLLTGVAAVGAGFAGSNHGVGAIGIVAGALASIVNTMEHGGQVGMVFEMYRNCGGTLRLLEETIESTLDEEERWRRENGELFEMKVALELGRSLEELRDLAAKSSSCIDDEGDFASKLF